MICVYCSVTWSLALSVVRMHPGIIDACKQARGKWSYTCTAEGDASIAWLPEGLLQAFWAHVRNMGEYRLGVHTPA